MSTPRDIRRCALQALYQFDSGNADDPETVRASLEASPGDERAHEKGFDLATLTWEYREEADALIGALTPEWPIPRQPIVDRNLLRLAYYEVTYAGVPPKVAINEAIELAREYSTDRSATFVNGVLDRLFRDRLARAGSGDASEPSS